MSFNILIATIGRPSLQRMLNSLKCQLEEQDCLTIVFDGHSQIPVFDISNFKCKINQHFESVPLGAWGHGVRNKYASILEKRDFVMHADDDDIYLPGVFTEIRKYCLDKDPLYIARMHLSKFNRVIPEGDFIRINHIGTPNGIIPFELNKKQQWKHQYGGDGLFYESLSKMSNKTVFLPIVIYQV
jgi:hypothetical protein